tara:strand:- start:542 stop:769 length:228 start_codon:yes stop_codon:yes gene_type:complete
LLFYPCTESSSAKAAELFCESRCFYLVPFGGLHKAIRGPYRAESKASPMGMPWIIWEWLVNMLIDSSGLWDKMGL